MYYLCLKTNLQTNKQLLHVNISNVSTNISKFTEFTNDNLTFLKTYLIKIYNTHC